ncbi:MAG TPA: DUF488 domain-containing protein [Pirellulaceae bacterium]|nr:DUF488 domain-containing protein [Pirellulaceae bacterium]
MLAAEGYIRESGNAWESGGTAHKIESLPTPISRDVTRLVNRLAKKPLNELTNYVDRSYPAFTVHRKSESAVPRAAAEPKVYTAGYEGLQVDGFLNLLVQNGIERLIDVRRNPIARRFGFHKSTLDRLCGLIGISYEHVPELGIASDQRQSLETFADYSQLFDRYERTTLVAQQLAVERVARLMVEKPSVLVCMEADACFCHRSRLAADVAERTGLPIVHLE